MGKILTKIKLIFEEENYFKKNKEIKKAILYKEKTN